MNKQKLELTWIGKNEELKFELRILIEDSKKSYGDCMGLFRPETIKRVAARAASCRFGHDY